MSLKFRRGSAALGLAATLLLTVPAPSWAGERAGASVLESAWSWLTRLWPGTFLSGFPTDKEGSMIDPNGGRKPPYGPPPPPPPNSRMRSDEGSMIDPNGGHH